MAQLSPLLVRTEDQATEIKSRTLSQHHGALSGSALPFLSSSPESGSSYSKSSYSGSSEAYSLYAATQSSRTPQDTYAYAHKAGEAAILGSRMPSAFGLLESEVRSQCTSSLPWLRNVNFSGSHFCMMHAIYRSLIVTPTSLCHIFDCLGRFNI